MLQKSNIEKLEVSLHLPWCTSLLQNRSMIYGYERVSAEGQDLQAQTRAMTKAKATEIFAEKISGATADRPQLKKLLKRIAKGDVVIVTSYDHLARSARDLLNIAHDINAKDARLHSIKEGGADPNSPSSKLMVSILASVAEFERSMINARTAVGRAQAKARGVKFGRKPALAPLRGTDRRPLALARIAKGDSTAQIAAEFGVSRHTIWRLRRTAA